MEPERVFGGWVPVGQAGEGDPRQTAGARTPKDRNHNGLGKDLADDAPAARPESHADGKLASAVCRARRQQAAEGRAGGKEHNNGPPKHPTPKSTRTGAPEVAQQGRTARLE